MSLMHSLEHSPAEHAPNPLKLCMHVSIMLHMHVPMNLHTHAHINSHTRKSTSISTHAAPMKWYTCCANQNFIRPFLWPSAHGSPWPSPHGSPWHHCGHLKRSLAGWLPPRRLPITRHPPAGHWFGAAVAPGVLSDAAQSSTARHCTVVKSCVCPPLMWSCLVCYFPTGWWRATALDELPHHANWHSLSQEHSGCL